RSRFRRQADVGHAFPIWRPPRAAHGRPPLSQTHRTVMSEEKADAFVFFGATGDLAYKQIFPALMALTRDGELDMPIIGVAKSGWNLDQLKARARESIEKHGPVDEESFAKLTSRLQYVDGDYADTTTFTRLRQTL